MEYVIVEFENTWYYGHDSSSVLYAVDFVWELNNKAYMATPLLFF